MGGDRSFFVCCAALRGKTNQFANLKNPQECVIVLRMGECGVCPQVQKESVVWKNQKVFGDEVKESFQLRNYVKQFQYAVPD